MLIYSSILIFLEHEVKLFENIQIAYGRIESHLLKTPTTLSNHLSSLIAGQVYLKNEHLQYTGSFKLRGALNKVLSLDSSEKKRGVIAASTGNHGLGVAYASQLAGVSASIYVPETASLLKLKGISFLGAKIRSVAGDCLKAELLAKKVAHERKQIFISPYNDLTVIAGQGTLGLEVHQQCGSLDAIFVSVGGGGLISGVAAYLKQVNPTIAIVGCWPKNSPIMLEWMKAGRAIDVPELPTLSDATAGAPESDTITLPYCQQWIDESVLVSEEEIRNAIRLMAQSESWIVEGAAAVAVAGLIQKKDIWMGKKIAVLLCGRNIDFEKFRSTIHRVDSD